MNIFLKREYEQQPGMNSIESRFEKKNYGTLYVGMDVHEAFVEYKL